jgi:hypothetical protein
VEIWFISKGCVAFSIRVLVGYTSVCCYIARNRKNLPEGLFLAVCLIPITAISGLMVKPPHATNTNILLSCLINRRVLISSHTSYIIRVTGNDSFALLLITRFAVLLE